LNQTLKKVNGFLLAEGKNMENHFSLYQNIFGSIATEKKEKWTHVYRFHITFVQSVRAIKKRRAK